LKLEDAMALLTDGFEGHETTLEFLRCFLQQGRDIGVLGHCFITSRNGASAALEAIS
jgi:hypothetical protein